MTAEMPTVESAGQAIRLAMRYHAVRAECLTAGGDPEITHNRGRS